MTEKPGRETVPLHAHPDTEQAAVAGLVASIVAQCAAAMGRPERVAEDCRRLRALLPASPADWPLPALDPLLPVPAAKPAEFAAPVCALIEEATARSSGSRSAGAARRQVGRRPRRRSAKGG